MKITRPRLPLLTILFGGVMSLMAAPCDSLARLSLPNTAIDSAEEGARGNYQKMPPFCRVSSTLRPTADSTIRIEVWMPDSAWNGKLQSVGNGGFAGTINYAAMVAALSAGYAAAGTDTGHAGPDPAFVLGHPEKLIDYGYRAVHEMTLAAKQIIATYYGDGPKRSFWNGCSTGGRQALTEAQRFPDDYDGIIAGAPANNVAHMTPGQIWIAQAVHKDDASFIPPALYPVIHAAVLQACDALDGVKDGVIEDPSRCHFDPKTLPLTPAQIAAVTKIYGGPKNPRTGEQIFPGLAFGSEPGWAGLAGPKPFGFAFDTLRYEVFKNPAWDYRTFDFDRDLILSESPEFSATTAVDPKLTPFFTHGGKLLMYHGWSDPLIAPQNSINYFNNVRENTKGDDSIRLFMVPGMGHCRGGDGTDTFDAVAVMDKWVDSGKAPESIQASHKTNGTVDRTRPLCSYPSVARYKGGGSTDDAANFVCRRPV